MQNEQRCSSRWSQECPELQRTLNPALQMQNGFVRTSASVGFPLQKQAGSFADLAAFSGRKSAVPKAAIRSFAEAAELSEDYYFLGIFQTVRLFGRHSSPLFIH